MKQRCYNKNTTNYKYYGAKNITICDEWLDSFQSFYDWAINNGYRHDLTIDRKEPDENYCPENCRWVTIGVNSKNVKRKRKKDTDKDVRNSNLPDVVTPKQLAEFLQVSELTVKRALKSEELKGFKVGRDWRIEKKSVVEWVGNKN